MRAVGVFFGLIDSGVNSLRDSLRGTVRSLNDGPLQSLLFWLILTLLALTVLISGFFKTADRWLAKAESLAITVCMLGMTALTFNDFLAREYRDKLGTDLLGLWSYEGGVNFALLLMVLVGFLGASLATRRRKHLAIDGASRVLSQGPARFVARITALVSAGLCARFTQGAWQNLFESSNDAFPGLKIWGWLVRPINAITSYLPGDKWGPGTPYPRFSQWEDAMYDAGHEWDQLPLVWAMVKEGDKFPLWIPLAFICAAFALMTLRFLAEAIVPPNTLGLPHTHGANRRVVDVILAGALPGALITLGLAVWLGKGWLILMASLFLVFLGAPLFVAVGVGTLASWTLLRDGGAHTVVNDMFEATKKEELLAIPFFVLAGNLMTRGTIARRLIEFAQALLGPLPGGLGVGAVLSCAIFAAISGSSPVTVIAIGTILFPMLVEGGYSEKYAMGVLTSAGGLGIIIPPSIPMIVYAIMVSALPGIGGLVTPKRLFIAGILPGLFIASMLALYTLYLCWPRGDEAQALPSFELRPYLKNLRLRFRRGALSLFLPVLILGGIYAIFDLNPLGIPFVLRFSVTEAAAVAVVYALFIELVIHRELKLKQLPEVITESAVTMGTLFLILMIAISLNRFFSFEQIPEQATAWMLANVHSKVGFLILVNVFLLALGCVMDILSAILIVAPLLAPIAMSYGIDPVHFGIMFIVNLELGYLTPPMGLNLFVASSVFDRPILDVIKAVIPFLFVMLFCLIVIVWFPSLSLALLPH